MIAHANKDQLPAICAAIAGIINTPEPNNAETSIATPCAIDNLCDANVTYSPIPMILNVAFITYFDDKLNKRKIKHTSKYKNHNKIIVFNTPIQQLIHKKRAVCQNKASILYTNAVECASLAEGSI